MMDQTADALFRDKVILAPLTKGGNLPFRRLVTGFGARMTVGEMAMARNIVRRQSSELALLRRAEDEPCFGAQLADKDPIQIAKAAQEAERRGASFLDLNLGCPIDEFCRRGLGAALLLRPKRVRELVEALRAAIAIPVTVKLRLGWSEDQINYLQVAQAAVDGGAQAITLHGRSRRQRYRRAADWNAIAELASALAVPVIGNGDLLTWRDVEQRRQASGCASVMLGRAALIKPWVFAEIDDRRDYLLDAPARYQVLELYRDLALAHFRDDERGQERVRQFLTWHLDLFGRYRPVDSASIDPEQHPLLQTREEEQLCPDPQWQALFAGDLTSREALTARLLAEWREQGAGPTDTASVRERCRAILATAHTPALDRP